MKPLITLILMLLFFSPAFSQVKTSTAKETIKPFVLGEIREIKSAELAETRILNIYLPEGYNASDTTKYAVIYLLDGSADEDFIHVTGIIQFNNFSWINRVPKSIVVGIATVDRKRDFTFPSTIDAEAKRFPTSGHSDKFISFIEKELQPFIDKNYKTNTSRMLIGQSLGGLLATEILMRKPNLFNKYIIISPSLWWDNGSLLNQSSSVLLENFPQTTGVYIGVGKEGLTPSPDPHVMEVDANLLAEKLMQTKSKNVTVHFDYLPQEDHATIAHQAIFNALRLLYPIVNEK